MHISVTHWQQNFESHLKFMCSRLNPKDNFFDHPLDKIYDNTRNVPESRTAAARAKWNA